LVSFPQYIVFGSMYETMSISTGLYPNLDSWNANKLHYIFPSKTLYEPLLSFIGATCPTHIILLKVINHIMFGEEYRS